MLLINLHEITLEISGVKQLSKCNKRCNLLWTILIFNLLSCYSSPFLKGATNSSLQDTINISQNIIVDNNDTLRPKMILGINYGLSSMSGHFTTLPGVENCCPEFSKGSGIGLNISAGYQIPILSNIFNGLSLGLSAGLVGRNSNFLVSEQTRITDGNQSIDGEVNHNLGVLLNYLELMPYLSYKVYNSLFLNFGISYGLNVTNYFEQHEELTKPVDKGYFIDTISNTKSRVRNSKSGMIKNLSNLLSANLSLGYELPLNKNNTLRIKPELTYNIGLNNLIQNYDLKVNIFQIGVGIVYSPFEVSRTEQENYFIDTIQIESEEIAENIIKIGKSTLDIKEDEGEYFKNLIKNHYRTDTLFIKKEVLEPKVTEVPEYINELSGELMVINPKDRSQVKEVKVQVEFVKDVYPLLPYIFFEQLSSALPQRYAQLHSADEFNIQDLEPNPLAYHKNNLNIIGYRLAQNPEIKLVIKGYIDPTTEVNNCELALNRSNTVKNYLVNVFGIDGGRITIKVNPNNCFPTDLTRSQSEEGFSENRRIEIEASDPELLFSLSNERYQRPTLLIPDEVVISPNFESYNVEKSTKQINHRNMFKTWNYEVSLDSSQVAYDNGEGEIHQINYVLPYKAIRDAQSKSGLVFSFSAKDSENQVIQDKKLVEVVKDTSQYEIESLTLTVFQVSQYNLDDRIKKEIRKFFEGIGDGASVYIKGYSDNLGIIDDNKKLSQIRSNAVKDYIKSIAPRVKIIESVGVGSDEFPPGIRSYLTPEERFISRTVQIEIKKELSR